MISATEQPQAVRILIADDDPVFRELAASCLRNAGMVSMLASDGADAMNMLLREPIDLAIIDLLMPQIDGLRLIALIRATPQIRRLPIIIITSQKDPSVRVEGIQVGANDYLTKPVDWSILPGKITATLKSQL